LSALPHFFADQCQFSGCQRRPPNGDENVVLGRDMRAVEVVKPGCQATETRRSVRGYLFLEFPRQTLQLGVGQFFFPVLRFERIDVSELLRI
jgi:hypothetical protein